MVLYTLFLSPQRVVRQSLGACLGIDSGRSCEPTALAAGLGIRRVLATRPTLARSAQAISGYACSIPLLFIAAGLSLALADGESTAANDDYWSRREQLNQTHADRLASLAAKCEELGLEAQATVTSDWFIRRDPRRQYIFLPPESDPAQPADDAPKIVRQWYAKFLE